MDGWKAITLLLVAWSGACILQPRPASAQSPPMAPEPALPVAPDISNKPPDTTLPAVQSGPGVQSLPPVVVTEPGTATPKKTKKTAHNKAKAAPSEVTPFPPAENQAAATEGPTSALAIANDAFNQARNSLLTQTGTNSYALGKDAIEALPQGTQTPLSKVLPQVPGVTQDSAAAGQIHVRNEHANLQYRINGIILPDGVSGFGDVLETGFIGSLSLVTGALPAEYGLRTSGLVDITTKAGAQDPGGIIGVYGGSHGTLTPSIEYGGMSGAVDYFFTGRYLTNDEGLENPTASRDAIHDHTDQGKGFGYVSALIDNSTRLSWISGASVQNFQIPNTPGLPLQYTFPVSSFDSSLLNERQFEQNYYDVVALQKKV
jgi:hypothetical protein